MGYEESNMHHRLTGRDEDCSQQELGINKILQVEENKVGVEGERPSANVHELKHVSRWHTRSYKLGGKTDLSYSQFLKNFNTNFYKLSKKPNHSNFLWAFLSLLSDCFIPSSETQLQTFAC